MVNRSSLWIGPKKIHAGHMEADKMGKSSTLSCAGKGKVKMQGHVRG